MTAARRKWDGLCVAGLHGLDYEGQRCDLCPPITGQREEEAMRMRTTTTTPALPPGAKPAPPAREPRSRNRDLTEREAKLPRWAQDELARARAQRDEAKAELQRYLATQPTSEVALVRPGVNTGGSEVVYLPKDSTVRFYLGFTKGEMGAALDVRVAMRRTTEDAHLEVATVGAGYPSVQAQAANVIRVRVVDEP